MAKVDGRVSNRVMTYVDVDPLADWHALGGERPTAASRADAWTSELAAGATLSSIADREGITRERVRQIVKRVGHRGGGLVGRRELRLASLGQSRKAARHIQALHRSANRIGKFLGNIQFGRVDECWPWTGPRAVNPRATHLPYGRFNHRNLPFAEGERPSTLYVHRLVYRFFNGDIPKGMTVDHICFNSLCCNPTHLQLLTRAENSARKDPRRKKARTRTVCSCGNSYEFYSSGTKYCRACSNKRQRKYKAAKYKAMRSQSAQAQGPKEAE